MPEHPAEVQRGHTIGFLKGKSAVRIHRQLLKERRMTGLHFWATGYCVSTVGLDEDQVRRYIREQEKRSRRTGAVVQLTRVTTNVPSVAFPMCSARSNGPS